MHLRANSRSPDVCLPALCLCAGEHLVPVATDWDSLLILREALTQHSTSAPKKTTALEHRVQAYRSVLPLVAVVGQACARMDQQRLCQQPQRQQQHETDSYESYAWPDYMSSVLDVARRAACRIVHRPGSSTLKLQSAGEMLQALAVTTAGLVCWHPALTESPSQDLQGHGDPHAFAEDGRQASSAGGDSWQDTWGDAPEAVLLLSLHMLPALVLLGKHCLQAHASELVQAEEQVMNHHTNLMAGKLSKLLEQKGDSPVRLLQQLVNGLSAAMNGVVLTAWGWLSLHQGCARQGCTVHHLHQVLLLVPLAHFTGGTLQLLSGVCSQVQQALLQADRLLEQRAPATVRSLQERKDRSKEEVQVLATDQSVVGEVLASAWASVELLQQAALCLNALASVASACIAPAAASLLHVHQAGNQQDILMLTDYVVVYCR